MLYHSRQKSTTKPKKQHRAFRCCFFALIRWLIGWLVKSFCDEWSMSGQKALFVTFAFRKAKNKKSRNPSVIKGFGTLYIGALQGTRRLSPARRFDFMSLLLTQKMDKVRIPCLNFYKLKTGARTKVHTPILARCKGFEPLTFWFVAEQNDGRLL